MAGLLDLFGGRSSDIYGEGLLTPEQRGGLGNIGLLALAGKLGQLAGPSFSPVPDFGAALGQAAGAYGASQEGAGTAALNAILTGQKGRKLQQELEFGKQLQGSLPELMKLIGGLGSGGGEGSGSTGGAAAPLGAGGGGAPGASGAGGTITLDQARQAAVNAGFTGPAIDVAAATGMAESRGNPLAHNTKGEDSYGYMQLNADAHGDKVKTFDLQQQMNHAYSISKQGTDFSPWTMYRNGQYKKYLSPGGAPPAAAAVAPAPAGGGGLLNLPQVPSAARDYFGATEAPAIGPKAPLAVDTTRPRAAGEEPPGFAGRQLVAQLGARSPIDDVSQYQQVAGPGGGEPGGGMVSGLLAPGGPLTRGVANMPAMPAAPTPANDPGLQLGPLAPAPAAAAPAAPGPGLLAPPGLPAAAALPRGANPAYGNVSNLLGILGVQAEAAGLKNVFAPLADAFRQSPAFQAQLEREKARVGVEFAGPMKDAEKAVELRYSEAIAAAVSRGNLPGQIILKNIEAQNDLRNKLASGPVPMQISFDKDGVGTLTPIQGGAEAAAAAEALKPTETQRNYDAYVKDAQMRNQPVLSRYDWERTKTQPDPVNAARIAFDVKTAEPIMQQAIAGQQTRPLLDEVVRLAYQTPEGIAGESGATIGKVMAGFGFAPTDRMSNAELLGSIQQRLIGPIREPGTSSDRDVTRYLAASPGLMSTGDGRVKLAEMTKALIDRNTELAKVYRDNLGAPDLSQKLAVVHNKPLFTDEQRAAIDETIRTRGGTVPGGVTPGQPVPPATAPPASAAPPGAVREGTYQGKPVYRMPDGTRKWEQ